MLVVVGAHRLFTGGLCVKRLSHIRPPHKPLPCHYMRTPGPCSFVWGRLVELSFACLRRRSVYSLAPFYSPEPDFVTGPGVTLPGVRPSRGVEDEVMETPPFAIWSRSEYPTRRNIASLSAAPVLVRTTLAPDFAFTRGPCDWIPRKPRKCFIVCTWRRAYRADSLNECILVFFKWMYISCYWVYIFAIKIVPGYVSLQSD
jgi:hypothetical protein